jgi:glycosyltransferase involved in cell wall biosynthesis
VNGSNLPVVKDEVASHIHFSVVVPSYNCAQWAERAVRSILNQDYENYTVYFVDDASTDNTEQLIQGVLESYPEEVKSRFNYRKNPENRKALYNICRAIEQGPDDTVIVLLDGDDYLSSKNVLSFLNKTYSNENVWLSTGSYVETGTGRVVKSLEVPEEAWALGIRNFQEPPGHPNIFSHLRTFRKDLYSKINPEDLLDEDGEHYKCTFDRALMYPMIEMSGPEHHEIIDKVLYVYNRQNPLSVDRVDRQNQLRIEQHLRSGEPYERIRL